MKIIRNNFVPFGDFRCMNILGLLFCKKNAEIAMSTIRHEAIHTAQQYEILCASALASLLLSNIYATWWYLLGTIVMPIGVYVIAWVVELVLPPYKSAYKDSPFEREAYLNQHDPDYLAQRALFAWCKYILRSRKISNPARR